MSEQVIHNKIYQWCVISLFLVYPVFVVSVLLFPFIFLILLVGFLVLLLFEITSKGKEKYWLRFLCLSWLIIAVPSFGIMPLLIAWRWHYFLPLGRQLGIFTGFTLTATYNLFIPTPELDDIDHPFPPLTELQIHLLGLGVLALSVIPILYLIKRGILINKR